MIDSSSLSQVDNRNSSATKRARTDGGLREDDWTCPSCGNVNFSFRTTCNMRNCTQSRPADHNLKSVAKPIQASHFSPSAPYFGSGAVSSMYVSHPPYGSSMYDDSPLPCYEVPFAEGSANHYNYGDLFSRGNPYSHFPLSGPSPYSGESMIANGGIYGAFPLIDRYGLHMRMIPVGMGPLPGFYPDEEFQKKDSKRDNDWKCPKCGNLNFAFRTACNMRSCNTAKPGPQEAKSDKNSKQQIPEGSWKCDQCNNINFPFRAKCNRQNCGADRPSEENNSPSETYRNHQ